MGKFKEFKELLEDGETAVGTSAADIAPVDAKLDLVKRPKPCKKHNIVDCKECKLINVKNIQETK